MFNLLRQPKVKAKKVEDFLPRSAEAPTVKKTSREIFALFDSFTKNLR
tara:strand:+ start:8982 stop:9125 length:144 start_codon:yes stop_codon:yes gene_type:complete